MSEPLADNPDETSDTALVYPLEKTRLDLRGCLVGSKTVLTAHKQFARSNTVVWAEAGTPGCRSASSLAGSA